MLVLVTRLGVHQLTTTSLTVFNRTTDMLTGKPYNMTINLTPEQVEKWRVYLTREAKKQGAHWAMGGLIL